MANRERRMVTFLEGNGNPFHVKSIGRNDPCLCGSGKKAKNCCGTEKKYSRKMTENERYAEELRIKAERAKAIKANQAKQLQNKATSVDKKTLVGAFDNPKYQKPNPEIPPAEPKKKLTTAERLKQASQSK